MAGGGKNARTPNPQKSGGLASLGTPSHRSNVPPSTRQQPPAPASLPLLLLQRGTMSAKKCAAFIAMGTNLGDRAAALHEALRRMAQFASLQATSHLYESPPMYCTDQPRFLNAVCKVETPLSANQLLAELKSIELAMGRERTFRNGPRIIDLDILFYADAVLSSSDLDIPHPKILERPFVLVPLCDISPDFVHPVERSSLRELCLRLPSSEIAQLQRVIPCFSHERRLTRYLRLGTGCPILMGILNVTPDSFSDGGHYSQSVDAVVAQGLQLLEEGASILDIGGESTRPGANEVDVAQELDRVIPVIRALRAAGVTSLISIDTRKARVAKEAILAGADIINDVSAGSYDPDMFPLLRELFVPYVAMHMRGTPSTMTSPSLVSYNDCVGEVIAELGQKLVLLDSLLPRWLQVIDPGIGFAKDAAVNRVLLRPENLQRVKQGLQNRAMLIGLSRKRFLTAEYQHNEKKRRLLVTEYDGQDRVDQAEGDAVQRAEHQSGLDAVVPDPSIEDRDGLTAGASCLAVLGGADILRVHRVRPTRLAVDALLR